MHYSPKDLSAELLRNEDVPTWNYRWGHLAILDHWLRLILLAKQAANGGLDSFLFVATYEKESEIYKYITPAQERFLF